MKLGSYTTCAIMALLISCSAIAAGKETQEKERSKGVLSGSFESSVNRYSEDAKTSATVPDGKFGTNNYLKLDWYNNRLSAGLQMEAYSPVLVGYPSYLKGAALTNYHVSWTDEDFTLTAGTFYEQFGSGLLFRAWEDRALGLNNALTGARVTYNFNDIVSVKALWGMPRYGMKFSDTQVKGADVSLSVSGLAGWQNTYLAVEGSVIDTYEEFTDDDYNYILDDCSPNTTGWSARVNLESSGFFFKAEYVDSGTKYFENPDYTAGDQRYLRKRGNAQLIETGYNHKGLGVSMNLRRLEWMNARVRRNGTSFINSLNYIPALCTQYSYMLTTLHPYGARIGDVIGFYNSGEIGGQIDVFYNFRRGTALGGKRGMKVHGNFSTYHTIAEEGTLKTGNMLFRDLSIDIEKQWSKKFKSTLLWSMQEYSPKYGANKTTYLSNIIVADLLYKYTDTFSSRLELQYLITHEDQKDWMAALLEISFAPHWSVYASDMFNHGMTKIHYYNGGVSYVKSRTRVALSYGRFRSGYICSGGVCRPVPAYTGASLSVMMSF